jgi:polar amino acid transport system permease protein
MSTDVTTVRARPEPIKAVPVRHPGRWVAVAVLAVLAAMFVHMLVTNKAFDWQFMFANMFRPPVVDGMLRGTLFMTIAAMVLGVSLGVVVAVMRLSTNPILRSVAWVYTWFFRAVPRVVLLVLFGNLGILWSRVEFGVPFDTQLGKLFGISDLHLRIGGFNSRDILTGFMAGLLALTLSEAAYMAEIVRAGIQSVDPGQTEAAEALGLSRGQALRRVVLPQAMRVIVPPTGNETIAMLKDTALLIAVPVTYELFFQLEAIGNRTFRPIPMLVAACLWYLALTSVLLIGQHFIERYFSRGYGASTSRGLGLRGRLINPGGTHGR